MSEYNAMTPYMASWFSCRCPKQVDEKKVLNAIDPDKDVDGFHPVNVGRLMIGGYEVKFPPCTPAGIQEMIVRAGVETNGAEVVVVGRSNIVGKPIANMMLQKGRAPMQRLRSSHTATKDLASHCKRADILIVAAGVPGPGEAGVDQARGLRHRRRSESGGGKNQRKDRQKNSHFARRCGFRCCQGDCRIYYPRARRGRSHDHYHADAEYAQIPEIQTGA